jgi:dimethylamine corrinoid protein
MDVLKEISDCITNMEEEIIESLIEKAVKDEDIDFEDIYSKGLNRGMIRALELYEKKEHDIPQVIVSADILNKGLDTLDKYGKVKKEKRGKVVLSVVQGDTHEIGKNIVKIMLEAAGYEVIDMGVNRSADEIIKEAFREKADVIGLASMMTTTRDEMKKIIEKLNEPSNEKIPYVIVGGGSITESYSIEIQADGYAYNAPAAVKLVEKLIERKN